MRKSKRESIFFSACYDCHGKTIKEIKALKKPMNTRENILYNEIVQNCINERQLELNYDDGSGRLYI